MSITVGPGIDIGPGISIGSGGLGFTISPSDFTNAYSGYGVTTNTPYGFTNAGAQGPGNNCYVPLFGSGQGGNTAKATEIYNYFVANSLVYNGVTSYVFNVSWDGSSSPTSDKVVISFYWDPSLTYVELYMGTVYTGDSLWQSSGQDIFNSSLKSATGTYNFPATFSLYSPLVTDNANWC